MKQNVIVALFDVPSETYQAFRGEGLRADCRCFGCPSRPD